MSDNTPVQEHTEESPINHWTPAEEEELLSRRQSREPWAATCKAFPNRSFYALTKRVSNMNTKGKYKANVPKKGTTRRRAPHQPEASSVSFHTISSDDRESGIDAGENATSSTNHPYGTRNASKMSAASLQSIETRVCAECGKGSSSDEDDIVLCDGCDQAYHQRCHDPPIDTTSIKDTVWYCGSCILPTSSSTVQKRNGVDNTSTGKRRRCDSAENLREAEKSAKDVVHHLAIGRAKHADTAAIKAEDERTITDLRTTQSRLLNAAKTHADSQQRLEDQVSRLEDQKARLEEQVVQHETDNTTKTQEFAKLQADLQSSIQSNETLKVSETELQQLKEEHQKAQGEHKESQGEHKKTQKDLENAQEEIKRLELALQDKEGMIQIARMFHEYLEHPAAMDEEMHGCSVQGVQEALRAREPEVADIEAGQLENE
ncbi:MAG: hypothetical protein M1830_008441 [Pleopsidium flavum]|nr:MAG: hypothetical protein M1830_008441 [Pleopsidium flavum]